MFRETIRSVFMDQDRYTIPDFYQRTNECMVYIPFIDDTVHKKLQPHLTCKTLEAIIRKNMTKFLNKHNIINPNQHGFLEDKSCLTKLLDERY